MDKIQTKNEDNDQIILESFRDFVVDKTKLLKSFEYHEMIDSSIGAYIVNAIKQFYADYENHKVWLNQDKAISESFNEIDSFVEVISAYLIGFEQIENSRILEWLIELKNQIDRLGQLDDIESTTIGSSNSQSSNIIENTKKKTNKKSACFDEPFVDENLQQLVEIFPQFSINDINKVYKKNHKNYEATIEELVLMEDVSVVKSSEEVVCRNNDLSEEDKRILKERIVHK